MGRLIKKAITLYLIIFFFQLTLQTVDYASDLASKYKKYARKTAHEKYLMDYNVPYLMAYSSKKILPGRHNCEFSTDLDMTTHGNMYFHRILSYFLYPELDIRMGHNNNNDCLILINKENPLEHIPDDYKILQWFNENSLIAAREKLL